MPWREELGCGQRRQRPCQIMGRREDHLARWPSGGVSARRSNCLSFWNCRVWTSVCFFLMCIWITPALADYPSEPRTMGINYGRVANNLPNSSTAVALIKNLGVGRVRIFDSDIPTIQAFANSGLDLIIGMANTVITTLVDQTVADQWIATYVVPYYPATNIVCVMVGNEVFADTTLTSVYPQVATAVSNLYTSLDNKGLSGISVSTAAEFNILSSSFPPSAGAFLPSLASSVMAPLLKVLDARSSYFYINVYPYFGWSENSQDITLDYALFTPGTMFTTDGQYNYTNLLDAQLDAMYAAIVAVGYPNVRIAISETGWPTLGDANQIGANISNAETYNNNLVQHILSNPTVGTPRRPGIFIPTFIFAVFDEDEKPGATTERNWGVLNPSGDPVYPLDMKGSSSGSPSGGSPSGSGGGSSSPEGTCDGKPSVLPLSVSFFGTLFNLRI